MKVIGAKLREIGMMVTLLSMVHMVSCEDRLDTPHLSVNEGKRVEVSLCVGLADEADGSGQGMASLETKSTGGTGFDVRPVSTVATKAATLPVDPLATAKPDMLYGLQILQYKLDSYDTTPIGQIDLSATDQKIGSGFSGSLSDNSGGYCQLLVIARGKNSSDAFTVGSLLGKKLSEIQGMTITSSTIEGITSEAYAANKNVINVMPYLLHLPKVKVVNDGGTYKIQSPDDTDVRILLRRMATRLTIAWENILGNTGYGLKQVTLHSIPTSYRLLPPVNTKSYPSMLDQYSTIEVGSVTDNGSYSCWIPTIVRGESSNATSAYYRTKENAPKGSPYVTFISQYPSNAKKKLNYRVYLGGKSSHDFNLYDNTNYAYAVTMSHKSLPVNDKRVTIIDPILASENNDNFVPTANCFMVVPGSAFCFNPYTYYVNGISDPNNLLRGWCGLSGGTLTTPIKSVKVLWQTLEDGDLGDPVLGTVNTYDPGQAGDDHTNIVDLKYENSLTDARIYCRVAPNMSGGSGVIAAYDGDNGTGNILWSWHVWVTDYAPSATGTEAVVEEKKRKLVYKLGTNTRLPMMDRNLGAVAGYIHAPKDELDRSKANGLMYQWGRKDPYRSSYTNKAMGNISIPDKIEFPREGLLSCYRGDGITFATLTIDKNNRASSYQVAYQNPELLYKPTKGDVYWLSNRDDSFYQSWGMDGNKGVHDPCPTGWRVCAKEDFYPLYSAWGSGDLNLVAGSNVTNDGGYLISYNDTERSQGSYYRLPGYWMGDYFGQIGTFGYFWTKDNGKVSGGQSGYPLRLSSSTTVWNMHIGGHEQEALLIRCVQERAN